MPASKKQIPGKPNSFPKDIKPMLATLIDKPFDEEGWLYEVKWDGYRAIAYLHKGKVEIRSRNNKSFDEKFYPVLQAFKNWKINAVVDGEIVVVNDKGFPDFGDLQNWRSEADGHLAFYAFDILWHEGQDLMALPLIERKAVLKKLIPVNDRVIKLSETFEASGSSFFALAEKMQLEGIMAKKRDGLYIPNARSKEWLKIKTEKRQEAIICGYTINENTSKPFSALLLGLYENGKLESIGPVGTGFSIQQQKDLLKKLKPLEISKCPFITVPDFNKPSRFRPNPPKATVVWVKPKIVCEISYRELTKDKALRHPSFKGLREDKVAKNVKWEQPAVLDVTHADTTLSDNMVIKAPGIKDRKSLLNPSDESQVRKINGQDVKFQNLSKIYWPARKVTKRDMLNYYYQVAPFILPYLKDRPQTLNRYPNGITGKAFYQRDVKGKVPKWVQTHPYTDSDNQEKEVIICNNEATLLYIAALGCIEINAWSSTLKKPDNPDWCIIDLDPDKNTFNQVIEAANLTKQILESIGVESFCKTSGSTGLHVYIPFGAKYTYEDSKEFGRSIATILHHQIPKYTSIERQTKNRGGKMYIDFLQNRPQATVASVYSLRPKPGAPVSMPLHWDEVKKDLKILDFTIFNAIDRIKNQGDIFKGVLGKGINLKQALKNIKTVF